MLNAIRYLLKPIIAGLVLAFFLLLFIPYAQQFSISFNNFTPQLQREEPPISFSEAVNKAGPAVVNIYNTVFDSSPLYQRKHQELNVAGSGVIMRHDGYILTNIHVISGAEQLLVVTQDGQFFREVQLIGQDPFTDLAVLKVNAENLPAIPINHDRITKVGDMVLAIGNPYNLGQSISQGIISATGRVGLATSQRQDFLQTDAAINQGNSGGALVNSKGELVGISTASFIAEGIKQSNGISFAVPFKLAYKIMLTLIEHGRVTRGVVGIKGEAIHSSNAPLGYGVRITGIESLGPADKAGLKVNDIILALDGKSISGPKEAMDIIAETAPGNTVAFRVLRAGQQLTINVTVTELKWTGRYRS